MEGLAATVSNMYDPSKNTVVHKYAGKTSAKSKKKPVTIKKR